MHNAAKILSDARILVLEDPRLSLSDLSRALGVERHFLQKLIRKGFGTSYREWRSNFAMKAAAAALRASDRAVKEIAARYGFKHSRDFSRAFKRHFGISPARFRLFCSENGEETENLPKMRINLPEMRTVFCCEDEVTFLD